MFPALPNTFVIGLGHKARHGKDTAAQVLTSRISGARRFSFADDLYAYCRIAHGMRGKDAPLLQRVGLELRQRNPLVWIESLYWQIAQAAPRVAVITDVRFQNEAEFVKSLGGVTLKVARYNADGSLFIDPSRPADHPSECDLDSYAWDAEIRNDGTLDQFTDRVMCQFMAFTAKQEAA